MLTGVILLILTGLSWVVVGIVISHSARKKVDLGIIQMLSALAGMAISAMLLLYKWPSDSSSWIVAMTFLALFGNGFVNFFGLMMMGKAMKSGPNGIVWATVQSALVFPFIFGIVFFGVELTWMRLAGITLIVGSVIFYGLGKSDGAEHAARSHGNWYIPAFIALFLAGTNQCMANLPSYWPDAVNVNSIFRAFASQCGTVVAWLVVSNIRILSLKIENGRAVIISVASLVAVSLVSSYLLLYNGLDMLAEAGAGAAGYPIIICSCIAGFFIYSAFVLNERTSRMQKIGFILGIVGIAVICI